MNDGKNRDKAENFSFKNIITYETGSSPMKHLTE
jgi:hypothetical protein